MCVLASWYVYLSLFTEYENGNRQCVVTKLDTLELPCQVEGEIRRISLTESYKRYSALTIFYIAHSKNPFGKSRSKFIFSLLVAL